MSIVPESSPSEPRGDDVRVASDREPRARARWNAAGLGITASSLAVPRRHHRGASRPERLERALLAIHGTILVAFVLVSVAPLSDAGEVVWQQLIPRLLIAVIFLAVAVDLQLRGERFEHLVVLAIPLLAVTALESAPLPGDVASGLTVGALSLSAARQLRPLGYAALMVPAGLAHVGARVAGGGSLDAATSDVVVGVGMTYAVYAFVEALHRAVERSAQADAETARLRREAVEEDARRRAVEAAGRALHDDVLVALRAAADPTQDPERVRAACASAVVALEEVGDR